MMYMSVLRGKSKMIMIVVSPDLKSKLLISSKDQVKLGILPESYSEILETKAKALRTQQNNADFPDINVFCVKQSTVLVQCCPLV